MSQTIVLEELDDDLVDVTVPMVRDHMNFHRELTRAPPEYRATMETARTTLEEWRKAGTIAVIFSGRQPVGFFCYRRGGQNAAWLDGVFIVEAFRGRGVGKQALALLDKELTREGVVSLFVDVAPRNNTALTFYLACGFDHLNLLQLRKNYDARLNKEDEVEVLGHRLKKY